MQAFVKDKAFYTAMTDTLTSLDKPELTIGVAEAISSALIRSEKPGFECFRAMDAGIAEVLSQLANGDGTTIPMLRQVAQVLTILHTFALECRESFVDKKAWMNDHGRLMSLSVDTLAKCAAMGHYVDEMYQLQPDVFEKRFQSVMECVAPGERYDHGDGDYFLVTDDCCFCDRKTY